MFALSLPEWLVATFLRWAVKPVLGPPFPIRFQRFWMTVTAGLSQPPPGTRAQRALLGGVPDVVVTPTGLAADGQVEDDGASGKGPRDPRPVVLYLHGGAFITGSYRTHAGLAGYLARDLRAAVHVIEYRLAPEHPWPAGADDALAAYRALLARVPAHRIVVMGDSAGGVMTADLLLALQASGEPQPAAAVMLSPAVGLDDQRRPGAGAKDTLVRREWAQLATAALKRPSNEPMNRILGRDLTGLPPIQLHFSTEELLADECAVFGAELRAVVGGGHEVRVAPGAFHVLALTPGTMRRARVALAQIVQFAALNVHAATQGAQGTRRGFGSSDTATG